MKKKICLFLFFAFLGVSIICGGNNIAFAQTKTVILGGMPAGFEMETRGALVVGLSDVITKNGTESPAKDAGIKQGDIIYFINDIEINDSKDIERALNLTKDEIEVDYERCGNSFSVKLIPAIDVNGAKKIGVFIKEAISGIGTVTFIDGERIATLGHPVLDESGKPLNIVGGFIYPCNITGYIAGERGKPGELRGIVNSSEKIATIDKNNQYGIFGSMIKGAKVINERKIELGEGRPGNAFIYTTINGNSPKRYSISIIKSDNLFSDTKNYVIKITDRELLETTGGIIQGMSGSPIVQDGRLVGAVTHVFIGDPTRGFGISINNMLNQ